MAKGFFITFEGPDGCGKTTQSRLLESYLKGRGRKVLLTREPGGTPFAEDLRKLLLDPAYSVSPITELMLFETIRSEHAEKGIRPALSAGKIVICDRYTDSTVAYQGYGRKLDLKMIDSLNAVATSGLKPDLTLVFDIPAREGLKRVRHKMKGKRGDRMEREHLAFHQRVRNGYIALARKDPRRMKVIDAARSIDAIQAEVREIIERALGKR